MPRPASQCERPEIAAVVVRVVGPHAEQMAHRIDAPGRLMRHEDPDHPAPEKSLERAPSAVEGEPDRGRQCEAESKPQQIEPVRQRGRPVADEIGYVASGVLRLRLEQPAHMGAPEPGESRLVRPMRILIGVGMGMMTAMGRRPEQDRPFARHRAESGEDQPQRGSAFECTVGEIAMKADLDADRAGQIEREEEPERHRSGPAYVPSHDEGGERPQGRHHHHGQRDAPMHGQPAGARQRRVEGAHAPFSCRSRYWARQR